ncbi:MAG: signal peptidase II [Pseudomonadota bacterium]
MSPRLSLFLALFCALGLDQFSKVFVFKSLNLENLYTINVFPPVLNFRLGWNEGINFGLFANAPEVVRWGLILFAIAVSIGVVLWAWPKRDQVSAISAGLLAGGAMGNAIDRGIFGAVRDFLNMSCCGINNPYVFNIADVAVFAGVFGLIYVLEIRKS